MNDITTQLENLGNKAPTERTNALHSIKLQVVTACKDLQTKLEVNEKIESLLKIREQNKGGIFVNDRNLERYGSLSLELINEANKRFNITKLR